MNTWHLDANEPKPVVVKDLCVLSRYRAVSLAAMPALAGVVQDLRVLPSGSRPGANLEEVL